MSDGSDRIADRHRRGVGDRLGDRARPGRRRLTASRSPTATSTAPASAPPNWATRTPPRTSTSPTRLGRNALFDQVGPLDVVVNCAGFSNLGLITDLAVEEFRSVVDVCLTGAFIVAKHAGQQLRDGGVAGVDQLAQRPPARGRA